MFSYQSAATLPDETLARTKLDDWVRKSGAGGGSWRWGNGYRVYRDPEGNYKLRRKSEGLGDLGDPHPDFELQLAADQLKLQARMNRSAMGTVWGMAFGVDFGILMAVYSVRGELHFDWILILCLLLLPVVLLGVMYLVIGPSFRRKAREISQDLIADLQSDKSE